MNERDSDNPYAGTPAPGGLGRRMSGSARHDRARDGIFGDQGRRACRRWELNRSSDLLKFAWSNAVSFRNGNHAPTLL